MGTVRKLNPVTPGQRHKVIRSFDEVTTDKPEKSLLVKQKRTAGRNSRGKMTVRHIGGGHKQRYRIIDFKRNKFDVPAKVASIEYDPNRTSYIALVKYDDEIRNYILCPQGLKVGDKIISGENVDIKVGNCLKLKDIPPGTTIHNVELIPGNGGKLARSAGSSVTLSGIDDEYAILKLSSGETRKVSINCSATIGSVSNPDQKNIKIGKAGRNRWKGKRPQSRGVAMNPVDHPHGGGEGKTSGGRSPVSPWGQSAKGLKTRRPKRSDKLIITRRKKRIK